MKPKITAHKTRKLIMFNSYKLFIRNGYHATSIRDIANSCEISIGSIYGHFGSKLQIFTTVIKYHNSFDSLFSSFEQELSGRDLRSILRLTAVRWLNQLDINDLKLIFIDWIELEGEVFRKIIYDLITEKVAAIEIQLKEKLNENELPEIDIIFLLKSYIVFLIGFAISKPMIYGTNKIKEKELKNNLNIFFEGIFA